ncbi:MAG TPA: autotransporter domain-containing protein, partial [Reyranella sp.]|nr:autotransporter domain-containing protein [Reyranella sp.]
MVVAWFRKNLSGSVAIAPAVLALALAMVALPLAGASAQINCAAQNPPLSGNACTEFNQQYQLLQQFQSLPNSAAGLNVLQSDLATVQNIYLNATVAQRNQAATNYNLTNPAPQQNIWGMLTPSNQLYPSLQTFPQLQLSAPLAAAIGTPITGQSGVFSKITSLLDFAGSQMQIGALKDNFTAYAQGYPGLSTQYANPGQVDPRPFQLSQAIANAPWTLAQASSASVANQQGEWGSPGGGAPNGPGFQTSGGFPSGHSTIGDTTALLYAMMLPQAYQSLMVSAQQFGLSRNILGVHHPLDVIGARVVTYFTMTQLMAGNPTYNVTNNSFQPYVQQLANELTTALGPAVTAVPYASCASNVAACIANGTFATAAQFSAANQAYALQATYGLPSIGPTNAAAVVPQNAQLLIASRFPYLISAQLVDVLATTELPSGGPLDDGSGWVRLNLYAAAGGYGAFNSPITVTMNAAQGGFNAIDMWSNNIGGSGSLTLQGSGTLVLGGNNTYTGGTTVGCATGIGCATLALTGTMIGSLTTMPGATFVTGGGYSVSPGSTLNNGGTFQSVNASLLNQGTLLNSGTMLSDLINGGSATNTGTLTGNVSNAGSFINNGVVNGAFNNVGMLSGSGTVGNFFNMGVVAPGNSIGTMNVAGNFVNAASGTYVAEVVGQGQSDRIAVAGAAALQGGTVVVSALPGLAFAPSTTNTILNAAGGLTGTFAAVNELYPFLLSNLSYDANNAYLTLQVGGFAAQALNPNQYAVGSVLDASAPSATGDYATVLGTLATATAAQGQAFMTAVSGQNYAGFSSSMVQGAQLFMNNFANQTGGGGSPVSNRVALAEACDVACDTTQPPQWGAWGGGLGGLGTIGANQPLGTVTYNVGGFAAGLDRLITPTTRLGVTAGYTTGTQWVGGFDGVGRTDTFQTGLYGGYSQDKVYADAIVGYAYGYNQMWRNIPIPGLGQRTAQGRTGANQFFGQAETGYRVDLGGTAEAFVTPFARLQAYTGTQNGFTETGAQSLNLTVAQQTTNSLRSVLGAQLGGAMDLGWREKLAMQFRLGWSHEYADTGRPVTATLAGAPALAFTTYGVAPQRDGALVGFSANTS